MYFMNIKYMSKGGSIGKAYAEHDRFADLPWCDDLWAYDWCQMLCAMHIFRAFAIFRALIDIQTEIKTFCCVLLKMFPCYMLFINACGIFRSLYLLCAI